MAIRLLARTQKPYTWHNVRPSLIRSRQMRSHIALALAGFLALAGAACSQQTPLQKAAALLNVDTVKAVQVVASGKNFSVGQNYTSSDPWPPVRSEERR